MIGDKGFDLALRGAYEWQKFSFYKFSVMRSFLGIGLLLGLVAGLPDRSVAEPYPLTLEQREQLRTFIPRTFAKLDGQRPVHIVALGDSVTWMYIRNENNGNWLHSYVAEFADKLAREFFYTGGVRALNPEQNHPAKLREHLGKEIYLENLAIGGRCALDAIQRVTTDAFVNQPDLVVVKFGINDSNRGYSLDSYRRSLQRCVDACRENQADIIIVGPSITRASSGPTGWGLTRTQATVAREVAEKNGVLFVDMGKALAPLGGGIPVGVEPEAAVLTMADRLGRIFETDPPSDVPDTLHPNESAHKVMGQYLFDAVMAKPKPADGYELTGRGELADNGRVKATVKLRNRSDQPRKGYLAALSMGQLLTPEQPYHAFDIPAGRVAEFNIDYLRRAVQNLPGGNAAFDVADPNLRLSYFVIDEDGSRLLDIVSRLEPVSVEWISQVFHDISNGVKLEWQFLNGANQPTQGKYRIGMGSAVSNWVDFSLEPLAAKRFQATFPFQPIEGAARFKKPVFVEVEIGGRTLTYPREIEAVRDLSLGQRVALTPADVYSDAAREPLAGPATLAEGEDGVTMRADADANFLFFTFDIAGVPFQDVAGSPALIADLAIDARPAGQVGQFGFVDKLRINVGAAEGAVEVERPQLAAFGDGYNMILMPEGILARMQTREGGARRLEVRIPRSYLFLHEWQMGSPSSVLGVNAYLSFAEADANTGAAIYPPGRRHVHASPSADSDRTLYQRDARGLGVLRLTTEPVATWSAHLY